MKEPKKIKMSKKETQSIRSMAKKSKKVKITINMDIDSIESARKVSKQTGIPYQRVLNQLLKEALENRQEAESRMDRLEKELKQLKKKIG